MDYTGGMEIIVERLRKYEGYTKKKARKVVRDFFDILRQLLVEGKTIKLDGIGVLTVVERTDKMRRKIGTRLYGTQPAIRTIITINTKHKKTVKLRKGVNLDA
jgi:nucleoid DNA-binding protein